MFRIMTWNCQGIDNQTKRTNLQNYVVMNNIHYVFLQEGSASYTNPVTEANSNLSVFHPGGDTALALKQSDERIVELAFAGQGVYDTAIVTGNGGVSRAAYYNTSTPAQSAADHVTDDYPLNEAVRKWVYAPADGANELRNGQKKLVGGSGRRPALTDRRWCNDVVTDPIQARANLVAQRRPRIVHLADATVPFTVHYWHAPLGGATTLAALGLLRGNQTIAGAGCGGELAVAANLLFKKFVVNGAGPFPPRTLLVGDLNITGVAVDHIYGGTRETSEDGWCHIVAPANATLTLLNNSNTMALANTLGGSDHAPVVCDVAF